MTDGLASPAAPRFPGLAWCLGSARAQRLMWSEAFCKWTRRPLPSAFYARRLGDGQRFETRRGSWMSVLVPMVVFSQFVDVLLCQGALQIAVADPSRRWMLHGLLLFVSLWSVVWAVSLRSATRQVGHVLGPHALTLAVGCRDVCRIPLAAVAGVSVIDHRVRRAGEDWLDAHGIKGRDVTLLAALDKPTLLIELRPGAQGVWWTRNGIRAPLRRRVAVYVDQPAAMAAAITAAALPSSAPAA
jgi:hypothetical protein